MSVEHKADASPVTGSRPRQREDHPGRAARRSSRHPLRRRGGGFAPAFLPPASADRLLPRRSARRHQGIHQQIRISPSTSRWSATACRNRHRLCSGQRQAVRGRPGRAEALEVDAERQGGARRSGCAGGETLTVVASRSHRTPETDDLHRRSKRHRDRLGRLVVKFCLIAEGEADIYPRFGRTMEWDTAAGDAVLRAAGGMTVDARRASRWPMASGKQAHDSDFANPHFVASAGHGRWPAGQRGATSSATCLTGLLL
jgi:hypothetical protein